MNEVSGKVKYPSIFFFYNFYRCTVHFKIYVVHTPTNELFNKIYTKIYINIVHTCFGL